MKTLATFLLLLLSVPSWAQISFTYDEALAAFVSGQTTSATSYHSTDLSGLPALVANSGAAKSWDFGSRVYTQTTDTATYSVFAYPGDAPLSSDPDFTSATHVQKIVPLVSTNPTVYMYVKLNSSGMYLCGMVLDSAGKTTKIGYVPPMQQAAYPLTYQTSWSSTSNWDSPLIPAMASISQAVEATVDGYGTLVLPTVAHGKGSAPLSSTDCLRIKRKLTQTVTYNGIPISTSTSYSYEWMTVSGNSASIGTDQNSTPQSVSYSNGGSAGVTPSTDESESAIWIGSNPLTASTMASVTLPVSGEIRVSLMDILGHESHVLLEGYAPAGENVFPIDASTLSNGTYFLRVEAPSFSGVRKLIVSH